MTAEDWGYSPTPHTPPMVLNLTEGWPTRPRRDDYTLFPGPVDVPRRAADHHMSGALTLAAKLLRVESAPPRRSLPRHAMGGKQARTLNAVGLGCTAEPRRAAQ